ncbi:MAG TPA: GtrA family protein [Cytophagales bacterium]|nr:GtrA family protein [Cytophagales bacterium]
MMDFTDKTFLIKFLKFALVGSLGVVVDFGVTYLFKEKLKSSRYFANSMGFIVASTHNYILNRWWTFHNNDPNVLEQFLKYIFICTIGLGFSNLLIYLFNERGKMNFYLAKAFSILIVFLWNFVINYIFTFHN